MPSHINKASLPPNLYQLPCVIFSNNKSDGLYHTTGLLTGCGSQILWDFQGQIREIIRANFAEKQLVKRGQFHGDFLGKFH